MTMPRNSSGYEEVFHLLYQIFSHPASKDDKVIKRADAKAAVAFRLRYYSFIRSKRSEAHALTGEQRDVELRLLTNVARFKVLLEDASVRFTDRDTLDKELSNSLLADLAMLGSSAPTQTPINTPQSDIYENMIAIPSAPITRDEPPSPAAETADVPTGIKPVALLTNTLERILHGAPESFTIPFSSPAEAQGFYNAWVAYLLDKESPRHSVGVDGKNVLFSRMPAALNMG